MDISRLGLSSFWRLFFVNVDVGVADLVGRISGCHIQSRLYTLGMSNSSTF